MKSAHPVIMLVVFVRVMGGSVTRSVTASHARRTSKRDERADKPPSKRPATIANPSPPSTTWRTPCGATVRYSACRTTVRRRSLAF